MFKKTLHKALLPIIVLILTLVTAFALVQQSVRLSANEEISTLNDNIISAVEKNRAVLDNQPQDQTVDPTKSNLIFIQAVNEDGSIIFSTLALDGDSKVQIPKNVLEYAKKNTKNAITWAPKKDVRLATVVRYFGGDKPGYIITGKSLKSNDAIVYAIAKVGGIGLLVSIVVLLIFSYLAVYMLTPREKKVKKGSKEIDEKIAENNSIKDIKKVAEELEEIVKNTEEKESSEKILKNVKTTKSKLAPKKK